MARCLRCHAGNEWIEGAVPPEPNERIRELEDKNRMLVQDWTWRMRLEGQLDHLAATGRLHAHGCETCDAVRIDIERKVAKAVADAGDTPSS